MSTKIPLVQYLFRRLRQNGVHTMFGVPGDFTLKALDHLKPCGIKWIGNCNELNAGYAADGYARVNGLGALFTTYGVGELSAMNAVAGSYAEGVPVIHIVGLPQRSLMKQRAIVHHTLGDGRNTIFEEMSVHLLKNGSMIDQEKTAIEHIDSAIRNALYNSRPSYIALPCDMFAKEVLANPLQKAVETKELNGNGAEGHSVANRLIEMISTAKQPLILVDRSGGIDIMRTNIDDFVRHTGIPTLTMPSGASMIDHTTPNYFGVHGGMVGQTDTSDYVAAADLVLAFGTMFSDTQTLGWKIVPSASKTVKFSNNCISFPEDSATSTKINLRTLLPVLTQKLDPTRLAKPDTSSLGNFRTIKPPEVSDHNAPLNQTSLYLHLNSYLRPHDTILLGNATPILGGRDFILPDTSCRVIASGMWFSIGHMLPAALGAALAQQRSPDTLPDHGRAVLFDGDGSFQVTAQELSTIIHQRLNVTIFIINNDGYAYERLIHGLNESYNDIASWDYLSLPAAFGAAKALKAAKDAGEVYSIDTIRLETQGDLEAFLKDERFDNGHSGRGARGLKMVDIKVGRTDVPKKFRAVFESAGQNL
ncbi:hypothetical protein H2198_004599 [Neophaeococcomyces mojaviensis]|uniref:Uncharacterized protein n=1 Tax=Neophaeococcomyces mojaviensis TaxID=3383035 RepID=A0ACC3A818_9EURO|nr:hypothetical protein H2198_004599 [Knufia sp. JES_112]